MAGNLIDPRPPQWQRKGVCGDGQENIGARLDQVASLAKEITEVVSKSDVKSADMLLTALMLTTNVMLDIYTEELGEAAMNVAINRANKLVKLFEVKRG